jgi:hypothetical protein
MLPTLYVLMCLQMTWAVQCLMTHITEILTVHTTYDLTFTERILKRKY